MGKTVLEIDKTRFKINGKLTYSEIKGVKENALGLLMNARFIQGIFDDKTGRERYARFGRDHFCPDENTKELIAALPEWYRYGLRAITVGFQGGGPCFTINNFTIENNPYSEDGTEIDGEYLRRMKSIIDAADEIGMVVIVSLFYATQVRFLRDNGAIRSIVTKVSEWIRDNGFTNVIVEINNEHNDKNYLKCPILHEGSGVAELIGIVKSIIPNTPVGCSGFGGNYDETIGEASSVVIIHGNGLTRQHLYKLIKRVKESQPGKPIVINEDSQAIGQMDVTYREGVSWGYYNNMTKQEPPTNWTVTKGEDMFFAMRMAEGIGIEVPKLSEEDSYYLQGLEPDECYEGQRWPRVASLYPETINYVEFYRDDEYMGVCYDEPFTLNFECNWRQSATKDVEGQKKWSALIHLSDGRVIKKEKTL